MFYYNAMYTFYLFLLQYNIVIFYYNTIIIFLYILGGARVAAEPLGCFCTSITLVNLSKAKPKERGGRRGGREGERDGEREVERERETRIHDMCV